MKIICEFSELKNLRKRMGAELVNDFKMDHADTFTDTVFSLCNLKKE